MLPEGLIIELMKWSVKVAATVLVGVLFAQPSLAACISSSDAIACEPLPVAGCHSSASLTKLDQTAACCEVSSAPPASNASEQKIPVPELGSTHLHISSTALPAQRVVAAKLEQLVFPPEPAQALLCTFLI